MLNKIILPYTIWYTGLKQILRLNLDKDIETVSNLVTEASLNGVLVNNVVYAVFNLPTKSIDIIIRSDSRMEDDNLVLSKEGDASYRKVINLSKYHDEVTGQTVDVEQIKRDILASITIPNVETIKEEIRQSLPTIPNYTLTLNENTLTLGKEGDPEYTKTIDLSKYVNGPAIDTEQLKRDIIAAIHIPDENTIKQNILAEVNPKLIDKDSFKNEVLNSILKQMLLL